MKPLGLFLICISFLAGSYFSVQSAEGLPAARFLIALAVGIAGIVLVRTARSLESKDEERMKANIDTIEQSLRTLVDKVRGLERSRSELELHTLRDRIDSDFPEDLDAFVQARESIAHAFGLERYAAVMNPFSAGERYLNRVWSASTDGYIEDAHKHLSMAREQFEDALAAFRDRSSPTS